MKRLLTCLSVVAAIATLFAVPPTQSAPAPTPPTAAPAKKVDFPQKGKSITLIVPWAAGGASDAGARTLAAELEKSLEVPVQVVNRPGAGSQVGLTALATSKPDGYTIGNTNLPSSITTYMDPDRQAVYKRDSLQMIGGYAIDPGVIVVKGDSPYKSVKDLVDGTKGNPEKLKAGAYGPLSSAHIETYSFEKITGVKFAMVNFDGDGPAKNALLGGHIDVVMGQLAVFLPQFKSGDLRILAVMDKEENRFLPGVKTLESQGYKYYFTSARGLAGPAGIPPEIVGILTGAMKKAVQSADLEKRMSAMGVVLRYLDPTEFGAEWASNEAQVLPIIGEVRKK